MAGYTIGNLITKNVLSRGSADATAVVFEDRRLTYGQLDERVDRLASGLARQGFAKGDHVVVLSKNRIEWVEAFFAVARLGGVLAPLNYLFKAEEISYAITDSDATWAIVEHDLMGGVRPIRGRHPGLRIVVVGGEEPDALEYEQVVAGGSSEGVSTVVDLNDLFLLQYTSGTTGYPKAAMHTHATVLLNTVTQPYDLGMQRDDVYLSVPALCWAAGFHDYTLALWWLGGTVVLNPSRALDPDALCGLIERERATIIVLVPSVQRLLVGSGALDRHDLSSLRMTMTGAEPVPIEMLRLLGEKIPGCAHLQGYGQSEFPIFTSVLLSEEAESKSGSAGKATSLCELRVVDEDGRDVPTGTEGAIVSRSPATMTGYYKRDDVTAETLVDGWLQSGDRGYVDEDGFLFIAGRQKDMLITGGLNVYPAEVERLIAEHDGVAEVAIVGIPHERLGEVGQAIVVLRDADRPVDFERLEADLRERVASFKVPRAWVVRDEPLPRTASGKIRKYLLRDGDAGPVPGA